MFDAFCCGYYFCEPKQNTILNLVESNYELYDLISGIPISVALINSYLVTRYMLFSFIFQIMKFDKILQDNNNLNRKLFHNSYGFIQTGISDIVADGVQNKTLLDQC